MMRCSALEASGSAALTRTRKTLNSGTTPLATYADSYFQFEKRFLGGMGIPPMIASVSGQSKSQDSLKRGFGNRMVLRYEPQSIIRKVSKL